MTRQPKAIVAHMFDLQLAIENCERSGNSEWKLRHKASLRELSKLLPSGSGIDNGTTITAINVQPERILMSMSFHHMNDQGSYDGWTEHTINVRPSFNGIALTIAGPNRNEIRDYLHEVYQHALTALVVWDDANDRWTYSEKAGER